MGRLHPLVGLVVNTSASIVSLHISLQIFYRKNPLISNAVSVVGSHLPCVCWSCCRRNSWCCNRISDYISLLSSLWHVRVFTSVQVHSVYQCWLKASSVCCFLPCDNEQEWLQATGAGSGHSSFPAVIFLGWNLYLFSPTLFILLRGREREYEEQCVVHCCVLYCSPCSTRRHPDKLKLGSLLWKRLLMSLLLNY